jgi:hypothetical protein
MKTFKANPKLFGLVLTIALIAIWIAVFMSIFILQPTLAQKTVIVTMGAVSTEVIFYAGAMLFGISAFKKIRSKFRLWNSN